MPDPVIIPRADHPISRRDIDSEALKVLYRLKENNFAAYLVGGSVRDLILGRRPKDFDIGTDAHPYQIKKLFRNCWIIGRRFRLAHIKFGPKTIEVATFRKNVPAAEALPPEGEPAEAPVDDAPVVVASSPEPEPSADPAFIHRDNTFGTPEEDAFRRDFTINGLFYDISTYSIIDYVGGLGDLQARVVRSIGDPRVRFVEDPVRMLRAAVMAARLGFEMDPLVIEAIAEHRLLIQQASPSRLIEEYYKILRSGYAEATFRTLGRVRLLELMTPELKSPPEAIWDSLARLDRYRLQFQSPPAEFTNTLLIGALLDPLGLVTRRPPTPRGEVVDPRADRVNFGMLPVARKDIERLRQIVQIVPRLTDPALPPRLARGLPHRSSFPDAVAWLEVFGDAPDLVAQWKLARPVRPHGPGHGRGAAPQGEPGAVAEPGNEAVRDPRRRRRRRRRRGRGPGPAGA